MQRSQNIVLGTRSLFTPVSESFMPFDLSPDERMRHTWVIGMTGMGKTTLVEHMIVQDLHAGHGVTFIDFHGDSVRRLLDYVPRWRVNDVVYVNPADRARPVGLNVCEWVEPDHQHEAAKHLTKAFKNLFADSWGPRLDYVLSRAIWAQTEREDGTLLGVYRMLVDRGYQEKVARKARDVALRSFWQTEFDDMAETWKQEAVAPILNKVGQVVSNPVMRNIFGCVRSTINFQDVMDHRRILFVNLAKGLLDESTANLLGSLIVSKLQVTAMARVGVAKRRRVDHFVYVDEFQNLSTDAFAAILSEARKYRLGLTLAHQYSDQLSEDVREAVLGNVGNMIAFRVGYRDAEVLEKAYGMKFPARVFTELGASEVLAQLQGNNGGDPFRGSTWVWGKDGGWRHPLKGYWWGKGGTIVKRSRKVYGGRRKVMEGKIERFLAPRATPLRGKKNSGKSKR